MNFEYGETLTNAARHGKDMILRYEVCTSSQRQLEVTFVHSAYKLGVPQGSLDGETLFRTCLLHRMAFVGKYDLRRSTKICIKKYLNLFY